MDISSSRKESMLVIRWWQTYSYVPHIYVWEPNIELFWWLGRERISEVLKNEECCCANHCFRWQDNSAYINKFHKKCLLHGFARSLDAYILLLPRLSLFAVIFGFRCLILTDVLWKFLIFVGSLPEETEDRRWGSARSFKDIRQQTGEKDCETL